MITHGRTEVEPDYYAQRTEVAEPTWVAQMGAQVCVLCGLESVSEPKRAHVDPGVCAGA